MKPETDKKLENLKKYIKTCPTCGKEFLGLDVWAVHYNGEDYKHSKHGINKYKLVCGKCPECQKQCVFYKEMFEPSLWSNRILRITDDGIALLIDYVKKFKEMPCSKEYNIFEWYKDYKDDIKKDELFNDDNIRDYVEMWLDCFSENDDICYGYGRLNSYESGYDLIDLLDFFK